MILLHDHNNGNEHDKVNQPWTKQCLINVTIVSKVLNQTVYYSALNTTSLIINDSNALVVSAMF